MKHWLFLGLAIVSEVIATSALRSSNGFTKLVPSLVVVIGYVAAFYCLSISLRTIPIGIAYAIWAGIGVVLVALVAWVLHGQRLDAAAIAGMALIIAGVVVMNVFSKTAVH